MDFNTTETNVQELFQSLHDNARLWIFQANRQLSPSESASVQDGLDRFLPQWTSHNQKLLAIGKVIYDHFVIIALDEVKSNSASGCSIDSMTHYIQNAAREIGVDFMDRSIFYFWIDGRVHGIPMTKMAEAYRAQEIDDETLVFNNLIKAKKELSDQWMVPLKSSWHHRFVN